MPFESVNGSLDPPKVEPLFSSADGLELSPAHFDPPISGAQLARIKLVVSGTRTQPHKHPDIE